MWDKFKRDVALVTGLLGVLSVMNLILLGCKFDIWLPLLDLFKFARDITAWIGHLVDPVIRIVLRAIQKLVPLTLPYNEWWVELFVPLSLYFSSIAYGILVAHEARVGARWSIAIGLLIALACSLAASIWPLESAAPEPTLIVAVGFVVFHLWAVMWHTIVVVPRDAFIRELRRFLLAYPVANFFIAWIVVVISAQLNHLGYRSPAAIQLLAMVLSMALRDIAAGLYGATFERKPGVRWAQQFWSYGTTIQGVRTFSVIGIAVTSLALARGVYEFRF